MTYFEIGAVFALIFLVTGIVVGVLIVIALPQIRYYRVARRYLDDRSREELPPSGEDDEKPPWWQDG
jgi:hypothetical protein